MISVPAGWNVKSVVPAKVVRLLQKFPVHPRVPIAFQLVEPKMSAK